MKKNIFLGEHFLLGSDEAVELYEVYAAPQPIVDYHNHLSPRDVAENRTFANITEAWLEGDHYKWRAMRQHGVAEEYCTGNASPEEKFIAWATTVPHTLLNPLYHWTHLELRRYFGIHTLLSPDTARDIYQETSAALRQADHRAQALLIRMNVQMIGTTDDPTDDLIAHRQAAEKKSSIAMLPTFRPDKAYAVFDPPAYQAYLRKLAAAAGVTITHFDDLIHALKKRIEFFDTHGCRASDHGLRYLHFDETTLRDAPGIFDAVIQGRIPTVAEADQLTAAVLYNVCRLYHAHDWTQQFHLGAIRNTNSRAFKMIGADAGFDSIGAYSQASGLAAFLDQLDASDQLAQTILYNLNPADNEVFATMVGNFCDGSRPGKIQWGSAWWFNDQLDGMTRQLRTLSQMGLLSHFVGMVTDSRSFLSFSRHEYFRRLLCNWVADEMNAGKLPDDTALVGEMIQRICYSNAKNYFRL